jgi:hypothetical protein
MSANVLARFFGSSTITQAQGVAGEPGVDIGVPAGHQVRAVTSGIFDDALSTANELVEKVKIGGKTFYLDYMHIDPSSFKPGQTIKAGEVVGKITTKDQPSRAFGGKTYTSTGAHLEFGVYEPGKPVGTDFSPGLDPVRWLSDLVGGKLGKVEVAKPDPDVSKDLHSASPSSAGAQAAVEGATGGALGWLFQALGVGLDATGISAVVGFLGRMFMTVFFIITGTVFLFKGLGKIKA